MPNDDDARLDFEQFLPEVRRFKFEVDQIPLDQLEMWKLTGTRRFFQDLAVALHAFGDDNQLAKPLRQLRDEFDRRYVRDPTSRGRTNG